MRSLVIIFRSLKKNSKITLINVLCMALGLVSTVIILGHVYQEFNYDNELKNSKNIYRAIQKDGENAQAFTFGLLAAALKSDFPEVEESVRVCFYHGYMACSAKQSMFNEKAILFTDPSFFQLFSFPLLYGDPAECLTEPNSVVISEKAAKKYFGNENPIGESLIIAEDKVFNVTGVFKNFPDHSNFKGDLILPIEKISKLTQIWIAPNWKHESDIYTFVSLSKQASFDELSVKAKNYISKHVSEREIELLFQPLRNIHVNKELGWESAEQVNVRYLYMLLLVAFLTLVISIANFLFLYIGTAGQRIVEIGVKKVCGASRRILFFEYFKEVMVIMLLSVFATVLIYQIYQIFLAPNYSFLPQIQLFDYKLALILFGLVILVASLVGIYPSFVLSAQKTISLFNRSAVQGPGKFKFVNALIITQFILCIALMATTFMVHKQTYYMANRDTGFAKDELISIPLNMHIGKGIYNDDFELFANELRQYPSIGNVSMSFSSPSMVNTDVDDVFWEGKEKGRKFYMNWESVSFNYFKTIGVEMASGREFSRDFSSDEINWDSQKGNFILNERAIKVMGIEDPIGKSFQLWGFKGHIVGVVKDYNFKSLHSDISPIVYILNPFFLNEIFVRINPKMRPTAIKNLETVWGQFAGNYPLEINNVNNQVSELYNSDQQLAKSLDVFSILSILIASIGMFTLTVLSINKRTKEIGIRKVNGANIPEIMKLLIKNYIQLIAIAFLIATPLAWYTIKKWLEVYAYKAHISWWIFAITGLFTLLIVLITVSWKSWKAANKNPVEALRYE